MSFEQQSQAETYYTVDLLGEVVSYRTYEGALQAAKNQREWDISQGKPGGFYQITRVTHTPGESYEQARKQVL